MNLKDLSNNIQSESESHTFVKSERVIRRQLNLHAQHEQLTHIIRILLIPTNMKKQGSPMSKHG